MGHKKHMIVVAIEFDLNFDKARGNLTQGYIYVYMSEKASYHYISCVCIVHYLRMRFILITSITL